jgi:hypothetical protein
LSLASHARHATKIECNASGRQLACAARADRASAVYNSEAISHADGATFGAMATHVDELLRERCRTLGLSEDEIARIEEESEAAVDAQIADEIEATLAAMPKRIGRKMRQLLARRAK